MSRKATDSHHGLRDVIGIVLLGVAILLFVAQISFDPADIRHLTFPPNNNPHNRIGILGAYLAWGLFLPLGVVAYVVPPLLAFFGLAFLLNFLSYVRERLHWSLLWSAMLIVALTGLLYVFDPADPNRHSQLHDNLGTLSAGGGLGWHTYGQTQHYSFGISLLGKIGASIVYLILGVISLLFLTNFHLGGWVRALLERERPSAKPEKIDIGKSDEEAVLDRRKRDLEKQAKKLQEEVERNSGLGADGKPVPEPTVRDLSIPQFNKGVPKIRKTTLPPGKEIEPAPEGEVISAKEIIAKEPQEVSAATTEDVLGKKS